MSTFVIDTKEVDALAAKFAHATPIIHQEMLTGMTKSVLVVEHGAKEAAPVLTGTLRRSITHDVSGGGGLIVAHVGTNVPYARAIEEGRPPVTITPKHGKFLVFVVDGVTVFARVVHQPARAARPFLKSSLRKAMPAIHREFSVAVPQRIAKRLGLS